MPRNPEQLQRPELFTGWFGVTSAFAAVTLAVLGLWQVYSLNAFRQARSIEQGSPTIAYEPLSPPLPVVIVEEPPPPEPDMNALVAAGDVENGARVAESCRPCHDPGAGVTAISPTLNGVVGRKIASIEGYDYSAALRARDGVWDVEHLSHFIENPRRYAPGTTMTYAGVRNAKDRADVIAWLQTLAPPEAAR